MPLYDYVEWLSLPDSFFSIDSLEHKSLVDATIHLRGFDRWDLFIEREVAKSLTERDVSRFYFGLSRENYLKVIENQLEEKYRSVN